MNVHPAMPQPLVAAALPCPPSDEHSYRYAIGDCVDHVMGKMRSTVIGRSLTSAGTEVYALKEIAAPTGMVRVMRGPYLVQAA